MTMEKRNYYTRCPCRIYYDVYAIYGYKIALKLCASPYFCINLKKKVIVYCSIKLRTYNTRNRIIRASTVCANEDIRVNCIVRN